MEFEWSPPNKLQPYGRKLLSLSTSQAHLSSSSTNTSQNSSSIASPPSLDAATSLALVPSVPVPLITLGKVFAPITAGSRTLPHDALEAARHLGLTHMLTAAMGPWLDPDEYWTIAALTDPLTAANLLQGVSSGQRRVIFTERGAAERLARQKEKIIPVGRKHDWGGFFHALNPIAALESVCAALQGGVSKNNALEAAAAAAVAAEAGLEETEPEEIYKLKAPGGFWPFKRNDDADESSSSNRGKRRGSNTGRNNNNSDRNYNSSARNNLFGGDGDQQHGDSTSSRPALALMSVRLALSLLRGASGRFLLLSGRGKTGGGIWKNSEKTDDQSENFTGADSLDTFRVHFIPGCAFVIKTHAGTVKITPAFLSSAMLQNFWRQGVALYVASRLRARRKERRDLVLRMQIAALLIAGAGANRRGGAPGIGGGSSSSMGGSGIGGSGDGMFPIDDEDEDDNEEPPEVLEVIQEMVASGDIPQGLPSGVSSVLEPARR